MEKLQDEFVAEDFRKGLEVLDHEMDNDDWLVAFAPITLLSAGGFLAVSFLENRESTGDLDYFLEPQWADDNDVRQPLYRAMIRTARKLGFVESWANDEMAFFVSDGVRMHLFEAAEKQNIVLWESANLRVLAVPLEWALERKLRRIYNHINHSKRGSDMNDALALLKHLRMQNSGPLDRQQIRTSSICSWEPPPDNGTMSQIATAYRYKYGEEAFT
ncbi:hypothetical protein BDW59DRAFT_173408 [Aspergillus cavernicola]|uniref:Nucleotidyltransferase family protein n=1 Tax=Aspergillus cavernicola TaxID=176166 RepID=A0ABR4I764_9EURO